MVKRRLLIPACLSSILLLGETSCLAFGLMLPSTKVSSANLWVVSSSSSASGTSTTSRRATTTTWAGDLDTDTLLAQSIFPIAPVDLIALAKETVTTKGIGTKDNGDCLASDFMFRAAFVETDREAFVDALGTFNLEDSFDILPQFFGWMVDPLQPNRVWFMSRQEAKHTKKEFFGAAPDGKVLIMPPQCHHIDFNEQGKITEFGFYTVDRAQGNTGGLGGAFGFFYGVGKPLPFPEGKPYKKSYQYRMAQQVGRLMKKFSQSK